MGSAVAKAFTYAAAATIRFIARLWLNATTIHRLARCADDSIGELVVELDRAPSRAELGHIIRVLIDHGRLVLTVPKRLEMLVRSLIRQTKGFGPCEPQNELPQPYHRLPKGDRRYSASDRSGQQEPVSQTVSICVRKGQPRHRFMQPPPKVALPRQLGLKYFGNKMGVVGDTLPLVFAQAPLGTEIVAPFCGSLQVESALARLGYPVMASDRNADLINLLRVVRDRSAEFVEASLALLAELHSAPDPALHCYEWRAERFETLTDPVERAAMYNARLRTTFFGVDGGAVGNLHRFTKASIEATAKFRLAGIELDVADFRDAIDRASPGSILYLDPPYPGIEHVYPGPPWQAGDSVDLFDWVKDRERWLLHLNLCDDVLAMYDGFPKIALEWRYSSNGAIGRELIILPRKFAL